MQNVWNLKKSLTKNLVHNQKLGINKATSLKMIISQYQNLYGNDWKQLPLKINKNHCLHINYKLLKPIVKVFLKIAQSNSAKSNQERLFKTSIKNEIFNNHLIEGYISSRRIINDLINQKQHQNADKMILNLFNAMNYLYQNRTINKENLRFLYQILTNEIAMGKEALDGQYYRLDHVSIGQNDKGIDPSLIDQFVNDLLDFINDQQTLNQEELIIKAIIIHFYFELIHPYYDFNGRMGRLLVLWYAHNNQIYDYLGFFSSALALFCQQYLKIFQQTRFNQTVDLTYFVGKILEILIKQSHHYANLTKFQIYVSQKFAKKLSSIQKEIIMFDQAWREIYQLDYFSSIDLTKIIQQFPKYSSQLLYREIKNLENYQVLKRINKRNAAYYIEYDLIK